MRIIVTGGGGRIGRTVVERLLEAGHDVTVIGIEEGSPNPAASYFKCDITDYEALVPLFQGADAVVHLAAALDPGVSGEHQVIRVNVYGSFNVYQAAAENGIERVVSASSTNALGYHFGVRRFPIRYLPVDESHPCTTTDAYSHSKLLLESIGRYAWDRDGISGTCLRFPHVRSHNAADPTARERLLSDQRQFVEELLGLPEDDLRMRIRWMDEAFDRLRSRGPTAWPAIEHCIAHGDVTELPFDPGEPSGEQRREGSAGPFGIRELVFMDWKTDLWAVLDDRDAAQAIEKSLTAEYDGSHALFITNNRNDLDLPVRELARLFDPPVSDIRSSGASAGRHAGPSADRSAPGEDSSLFSIERARNLIGFEPTAEYYSSE